jgi:hypothetical protein
MFLKQRTRTKDGKTHIYYSVCESLRVRRDRVVQRQVLHLGELNTTQLDAGQHSIDVLHGAAPPAGGTPSGAESAPRLRRLDQDC